MIFMLIMPLWAMLLQLFVGTGDSPGWIAQGKLLLAGVGLATLALEAWMVVEAIRLFPRVRGVLETEPQPALTPSESAGS
jgi:carbon starvation protein